LGYLASAAYYSPICWSPCKETSRHLAADNLSSALLWIDPGTAILSTSGVFDREKIFTDRMYFLKSAALGSCSHPTHEVADMTHATRDGQKWIELLRQQKLQDFFNSSEAMGDCSAYIYVVVKGESDPGLTEDERSDLCAEIWTQFIDYVRSPVQIEAPKGLLGMIARRTCWKWNQKIRELWDREVRLNQDHEFGKCSRPDPLAESLHDHGGLRALAIKFGISNHHVVVLELRHIEQMSNKEIAKELGVSDTAASNCYQRARKALLKAFEQLAASDEQLQCSQILRRALTTLVHPL
jgi:DNA-directed RNA polymerase specialized sigma24 family protein